MFPIICMKLLSSSICSLCISHLTLVTKRDLEIIFTVSDQFESALFVVNNIKQTI